MIIRLNEVKKTWEDPAKQALRQLRSYLNPEEPGLVRFLCRTWNMQSTAITYKEIREAILSVRLGADVDGLSFFRDAMEEWTQDYSTHVLNTVKPAWESALRAGAKSVEKKVYDWKYTGQEEGIASWIESSSATFVTNSTETQLEALKHAVSRTAKYQDMSVDTLSHAVRPMVGLNKQQTERNLKYFESMIEEGVSKKVALKRAARHAEELHRERAYTIARTELAFAYNHGEDMAIRQAQKDGYLGQMKKQWITADDERVCKICGGLDGVIIEMDAKFEFRTKLTYEGVKLTAPAHPRCRCVVIYVEVTDPGVHLDPKPQPEGGENVA